MNPAFSAVVAGHFAAIRAARASFEHWPFMLAVATGPDLVQLVTLDDLFQADAAGCSTGGALLRELEHQPCRCGHDD
jgi:hypothetical protein